MHKKLLKRSAALVLAGVMTFGNVNVYAQDNQSVETVEQPVAEASKEQAPQFLIPVNRGGEVGVGREGTTSFQLRNEGTETLSSKDYDIKVIGTEGAEDATITLEAYDDFELLPKSEWNNYRYLGVNVVTSSDCTAEVIKYKVQIYNKADSALVYESEELSIYPYTIKDKVLKYNDSSKDSKYRLEVETDEHSKFGGLVGGSGGDATEIWHTSFEDVECYLRPGYPSDPYIEMEEGYTIGKAELIPADAGTITRHTGAHNIVSVDLHAPAVLKITSSSECVLDGGNGFKISAPATGDNPGIFTGLKLNVEEYADEEVFEQLKEWWDSFAELKGYTFKLSFIDGGDYNIKPEGKVTVTMPIPEGWDASRTEVFYSNEYGSGSMNGKVSEDGKTISFETEDFSRNLTNQYILMHKSIPVEVKDWDRVVEDYIRQARVVNWMTGTDWESRFYEKTASADDVAIIALQNLRSKYSWDSPYHNDEKYRFEIPYNEFVQDAKDIFKEVPDLKSVDNDFIHYDAELDMMIAPEGGMGDAPLVTEVVNAKKFDDSKYAINFKLSYENVLENPDMSDETQYRKCALVVEDNGKGNWRFVSFLNEYMEDAPQNEFADIKETDWFYDAAMYVAENKIMTGLTEDTFAPDVALTRAQFATILYRVNGEPDIEYSAKFPDVADGQWYTKGVLWANSIGVVGGYNDGLFGPEDNITREQMALMMYRYAKHEGYDISKTADISSFEDVSKVSDYAEEAFKWAVGSEIIGGKAGNKLDPQGKATRAECAAIMMRFMEKYEK